MHEQPVLNPFLKSYSLRVLPEHVTILKRGIEVSRKYDLQNSHQDRCEMVQRLLEKWKTHAERYERNKARALEARRLTRLSRKTRQHSNRNEGGNLAFQILQRHRGRSIPARRSVPHRPSSLSMSESVTSCQPSNGSERIAAPSSQLREET